MPRNAAKKSNKNAKRLPVLIKLTNISINNNKKKKVNSNENNNNNFNSNNNINKSRINNNNTNNISIKDTATTIITTTTNTRKHKKKRKNTKIKKSIVNSTFTRSNQNLGDCDANITNSIIRVTTTTSTTLTDKSKTSENIIKFSLKNSLEDLPTQGEENILKDFSKTHENKEQQTEETNLNIENNLKTNNKNNLTCISNKQSDICKTLEETKTSTNLTLTLLSKTAICCSPPSPPPSVTSTSTPTTSPLTSPCNSSVSSLYPIVIETSESCLKHHHHNNYDDNKNNDKTTTEQKHQQQQQKLQQTEENNLNIKKKKIHSINNCCNCNGNNKNNHNNNNRICCTCCHTAVDTLKQHKSQNNTKNNNNNLTTSSNKRNFNNNNNNNSCIKQQQQKQTSTLEARATSASLTSSSSALETSNQSQEVKARLATLRTRKKVLQLQEQQQQQQKHQQQHQQSDKTAAPKEQKTTSSSALESTTDRETENSETKDVNRTLTGRQFVKKVSPVLDDATLNLIETLSEEVKKPNNKRKRSTSVALLSLATLYQPRPKRIAANPLSSQIVSATGDKTLQTLAGLTNTAIDNKNEQKQTAGNFLRPLPIEVTNTNTKKRARIMSLYERPFQAANDGRGSVVGNGYMTSSRSSNSSGGAGGGAMVINDTSDTQEMANQYYLSGTSGSGIAGNSNPSLVGNGSAINHAPTMGTLCNIGNTCYLNSVVYTLRFAPQFLHNLHHLLADLNALQQNIARARAKSSSLGRGISAVHMENARSWSSKDLASMEQYGSGTVAVGQAAITQNSTALTQVTQKSSHQLLTEKLHELYQSLHRNEINESTEPHHADTLLHAIQDVSSIFEGNQQQDAHEFLMCLLNSIRETSQTLIKAIAECPDVILNGYISNPDEIERDLMKNHNSTGSGGIGGVIGASNSNNSNSLASASSKTSSFFSRKSKRKDESKNSKNSRLQSPLKDAHGIAGNTQTTSTANSLFYLNTNDLNSSTTNTTPTSASNAGSGSSAGGVTSPSNSTSNAMTLVGAGDETDAPSAVALILKDKQRLEGKIRELGLDFFNEDFEGITVSTTKCLSCETITEQKETMIDIAVPVPQAGYESNEFMDRPSSFIQNSCITREYFRNENKYRCEQCCGYTEAIRSISYEVLPRLLIIQLSRFSGGMEKINSYIPTSFTLQCFCSKCCELSDANKLHIYKLYSVITHVGATMSVGHYIAYTCSLDWANEYINCPKEQRRRASQERNLGMTGNGTSSGSNTGAQSSGSSSGLGSSSTSFMKMKMKFGRSKASSSGDMSKNVKQLNGLNSSSNSKAITNGIGKLSMNNTVGGGGGGGSGGAGTPQCPVTCQSINCCAMRLTAQQQLQYQSANNSTSDFSEESSQYSNGSGYNTPANYNNNIHHPYTNTSTSANTSGYGSTGRGSTKASYATTQNNCSEPIWYMCDDDKIKAMTQREFEELLSPARKITITPYLLFYARYNLQSTPPKSATASSSSPGPVTSSPQTSWSNESLQSSGHSAHSSGMRM